MKDMMKVFRSPRVVLLSVFAVFTLSLAACGPSGGGEGGGGEGGAAEGSSTGGG